MESLLYAIGLGLLLAILDVVPMFVQKLPLYTNVAAFVHYFVITIVIVFVDIPLLPWWLEGGVVGLALTLPLMIHASHHDKKPLPFIAANALVLGSMAKIISHLFGW